MANKSREVMGKGTRRARAAKAEALLAAAFEHAAAGLCLIGADGTVLRANAALLELAGLVGDEVEGRSAERLLDVLGLGHPMLERAQAGERIDFGPRPVRGPRAETWWSGRLVPIDEGVLLWAEDVTARASAERESERLGALVESLRKRAERAEAALQALAEVVPAAVLVADAKGEITEANAAAQAMLGTAAGDRFGLSGQITLHRPEGELLPFEELPLAKAIERGEPSRDVELVARGRGWETAMRAHGAPVRGRDGALIGAVSIFEDLTGRGANEHELEVVIEQAAANAALLDALIELVNEGVVLYAPSGAIERMNGAAERVLGFGAAARRLPDWARVGLAYAQTPEGEPFPADQTPAARALRGESVRGVPMAFPTLSGERILVSASSCPVFAGDGRIVGAVSLFEDVTRCQGLEDERERLLRGLATGLRRPLLDLQEQARGLAAVEGAKSRAALLLAGVGRLSRRLDSFLDRMRLDAGELKVTLQPIEVRELVDGLEERLAEAVGEQVALEVPEDAPRIAADPRHLERILVELLARVADGSSASGSLAVSFQRRDKELGIFVVRRSAEVGDDRSGSILREPNEDEAESAIAALDVAARLADLHGGRLVTLWPGRDAGFLLLLPTLEDPEPRWENIPGGQQPWQD
ncbi:MAG: PAS domain S-box protein [Myxococcales bacterium]